MEKLFLVIIAAVLLSSCQTDEGLFDQDNNTPKSSKPIVVRSDMGGSANASNFKSGDDIWLWANKKGTSDGYIKAWHLTANDDDGNFVGSTHYWPADGSNLDVIAIHGNFEKGIVEHNTEMTSTLTHTVSSSQGNDAETRKSDLLLAKILNVTHNNIELEFDHLLTKIIVKLLPSETDNNAIGVTVAELEDASVQIANVMQVIPSLNSLKGISKR